METCVANSEPDFTCTICAKSCKMSDLCAKGETAERAFIAIQMQNHSTKQSKIMMMNTNQLPKIKS